MTVRRFPPSWSIEEQEACFIVRDTKRGRRWPNARPGARSGAGVGVSEAPLHSSLPCLSR